MKPNSILSSKFKAGQADREILKEL